MHWKRLLVDLAITT